MRLRVDAKHIGSAVALTICLFASTAQANQRAGVYNFELGTSLADIKAELAQICKGFDTIEIVSGPEPALDPDKQQVQFKCTKG